MSNNNTVASGSSCPFRRFMDENFKTVPSIESRGYEEVIVEKEATTPNGTFVKQNSKRCKDCEDDDFSTTIQIGPLVFTTGGSHGSHYAGTRSSIRLEGQAGEADTPPMWSSSWTVGSDGTNDKHTTGADQLAEISAIMSEIAAKEGVALGELRKVVVHFTTLMAHYSLWKWEEGEEDAAAAKK